MEKSLHLLTTFVKISNVTANSAKAKKLAVRDSIFTLLGMGRLIVEVTVRIGGFVVNRCSEELVID